MCREFLHRWRDCLLGAVATLSCSRCAEAGALQSCDLWVDFDLEAGYQRWAGGAALNVKIRKNDQFRQGHQPRLGVLRDPRLHVVRQLLAFMRAVGNGPRPGCTKRADPQCPCPVCPPLFPRSADRGRSFDLSRLPTAGEASAMVYALWAMSATTQLSSPASARGGVASPQPSRQGSLRPFSGCRAGTHKTRRLGGISSCAAPSFSIARGRRSGSSAVPVVHFQCCNGWLSGSARRPARAPAGPQPGPVQLGDVPGSSALGGAGRVGPGPGPGRARPGLRPGPGARAG